jgi:purine-binding chemotaxis protein CheW
VTAAPTPLPNLIASAGSRMCAIPLAQTIETMRPLPVEALAGMPHFVLGLSVIRGRATPIVHLGSLLSQCESREFHRLVTVRLGERRAALAVDAVHGVRDLAPDALERLPALAGEAGQTIIEAVSLLDAQLVVLLRATRIVPSDVWEALAAREQSA